MIPRKLLGLLVIPALVLLALACEPAEQSSQEGGAVAHPGPQKSESTLEGIAAAQPPAQDSDTTATTPTPRYPKLDATLQEVVQRYEDGEVSESEAAREAPNYHERNVLVRIDRYDTSEAAIAVDTWVGSNVTRMYHEDSIPPFIAAFVPVSLLGELSQQEGVIHVQAIPAPQRSPRPPTPTPKYPNIRSSHLQEIAAKLDERQITESQAQDELALLALIANDDATVPVEVFLSANIQDVAAWLREKEVSLRVYEYEAEDGSGGIDAEVPLSLLGALSQQEGVEEISLVRPWTPSSR